MNKSDTTVIQGVKETEEKLSTPVFGTKTKSKTCSTYWKKTETETGNVFDGTSVCFGCVCFGWFRLWETASRTPTIRPTGLKFQKRKAEKGVHKKERAEVGL